jgi:hypothetical protein
MYCNQQQGRWVDSTRKFLWVEQATGAAQAAGAELAFGAEQAGEEATDEPVFEAVIGFGKHKGKTLREVARNTPDYLEWILSSDFSTEVKQIVQDALAGRFPAKK